MVIIDDPKYGKYSCASGAIREQDITFANEVAAKTTEDLVALVEYCDGTIEKNSGCTECSILRDGACRSFVVAELVKRRNEGEPNV
jgi:hypothetical protein